MANWHDREWLRYDRGEYLHTPWWGERWHQLLIQRAWNYGGETKPGADPRAFHFAHVSRRDPTQVAFTLNPEHGEMDRHTRMRPGRYLSKFFPELGPERIRDYAARFAIENENLSVHFAVEATDIVRVYREGPSSCMSAASSEYCCEGHPVRVYASGELAVAYLLRAKTKDQPEEITARTLCWPEKKRFSRVYGDAVRLEAALVRDGYARDSLAGAHIVRIDAGKGIYVCPYIDGDYELREVADPTRLRIVGLDRAMGKRIEPHHTDGFARVFPVCCEACGTSRGVEYSEDRGGYYCGDCCNICENCGCSVNCDLTLCDSCAADADAEVAS